MQNDTSILIAELRADDVQLIAGLKASKARLEDFEGQVGKINPVIKFSVSDQNYIDLDRLQKGAELTRKSIENIAAERLDSGQIGGLTKEIVRAAERSQQLTRDLAGIKRELANPNRKSSISFLTDELRAAEREADQLDRKLNTLRGGAAANNLKLSAFQKTNLSYQINDVVTGLASGQNPTQILAQQGGQIAQIFDPAQAKAFVAAFAPLVAITATGVAAIALTYKITGDIRKEAERRLKVEEAITGAINKQRIAQRDAFIDLQKERIAAARASNFSQFLNTDDIETLKRRRDTILSLVTPDASNVSLVPATLPSLENGKFVTKANESFQTLKKELFDIESRIKEVPIIQQKTADELFNQRNEVFKKSQQNAIEFEKQQQTDLQKSVEARKEKIKELEKTAVSTFDEIYKRAGNVTDNPFVAVFKASDDALTKLRENLTGASDEMRANLTELVERLNEIDLAKARLDNNLNVFELRDAAQNFRNPQSAEKDKRIQDEFTRNFLANNPNYLFLEREKFNRERENALYNNPALAQFGDLPNFEETIKQDLARRAEGLIDSPAERLQRKLDEQIRIVNRARGDGSDATLAEIADRKLIALSASVDPNKITDSQREEFASVREREANRLEKNESAARDIETKKLNALTDLKADVNRLANVAETEGLGGIVRIVNEAGDKAKASVVKAPKAADTAALYQQNLPTRAGNRLTNY